MANKRTKIVATIGPASEKYIVIKKMVEAGVNVARLNFSHGSYSNHLSLIKNIRRVEKETGLPVAIMQDIQGPKIRLGILPDVGIPIKTGSHIVLSSKIKKASGSELPLDYPGLHKFVKPGHRILVDDGHAELKIEKVSGEKIFCRVVEGYTFKSHKGLNFPDSHLKVPILSAKDRKDLEFGIKSGVDAVALSFIQSADDIKRTRKLIGQIEKKLRIKKDAPIFLIAKIERNEAIKNIGSIIAEADGVMVARGDLAMESDLSKVPLLQKRIIEKANRLVRPVIVATQMLDSMQSSRRPTRAEISDVANAVIDHADALMLSGETATGKYPVETIRTMAKIITATEKSKYDDVDLYKEVHPHKAINKAVAGISGILASQISAKAILVASISGLTGRLASRVRSELPCYVGAGSGRVVRQLAFSWGVNAFLLPLVKNTEKTIKYLINYAKKNKAVKAGDRVVVITGDPVGKSGSTNLIEVREIK